MVKALPTSKKPVEYIWCQNEEIWFKKSDCSLHELYRESADEHQFHSDYDDCNYYSDVDTKDVWKCPNGDWIWDQNDGDVDTPMTTEAIMWVCGSCDTQYDNKKDADNCCT